MISVKHRLVYVPVSGFPTDSLFNFFLKEAGFEAFRLSTVDTMSQGELINAGLTDGDIYQPLSDYLDIDNVDSSFFKVMFVVNPWLRVYTLFHRLGYSTADGNSTAYKFRNFCEGIKEKSLGDYAMDMLSPQVDSLDIRIDFVGRFENLLADFELLQTRFKFDTKALDFNPSKNYSDYTEIYDRHTKRIIANVYGNDIQTFCYRFHNL